MGRPLWYTPAGRRDRLPRHCPHRAGYDLVKPAGPDGSAGTVWGSPLPVGRTWQDSGEGWWVSLDGCQPSDLLRSAPLPGVEVLDQAPGGAVWLVPRLLRNQDAGWVAEDHLRQYHQGAWRVRADVAPVVEALRSLVGWDGQDPQAVDDDRALGLVVELMALNYHLSRVEWSATGWLSRQLAGELLLAACGAHGG